MSSLADRVLSKVSVSCPVDLVSVRPSLQTVHSQPRLRLRRPLFGPGLFLDCPDKVKQQYPDAAECSIVDESNGCGARLNLTVVSDSFVGMPLLKRHRTIQNLLKENGLFEEIHALQIKAWTIGKFTRSCVRASSSALTRLIENMKHNGRRRRAMNEPGHSRCLDKRVS